MCILPTLRLKKIAKAWKNVKIESAVLKQKHCKQISVLTQIPEHN